LDLSKEFPRSLCQNADRPGTTTASGGSRSASSTGRPGAINDPTRAASRDKCEFVLRNVAKLLSFSPVSSTSGSQPQNNGQALHLGPQSTLNAATPSTTSTLSKPVIAKLIPTLAATLLRSPAFE
ncbi:unnamed protein product, partial [Amoebophrya sp. A120]